MKRLVVPAALVIVAVLSTAAYCQEPKSIEDQLKRIIEELEELEKRVETLEARIPPEQAPAPANDAATGLIGAILRAQTPEGKKHRLESCRAQLKKYNESMGVAEALFQAVAPSNATARVDETVFGEKKLRLAVTVTNNSESVIERVEVEAVTASRSRLRTTGLV